MPKKVCWLRGGVFVDVIIFEIVLNAIVFWLRLHFWRLGGFPFPIGKLMDVWKLKHQVVQIYMNPSKRKFQKEQSLVLQIRSKGLEETKNNAHFIHIKCRLVLDVIWSRKTSEQGLHLPTQLHRCVQAPKLGNHWLVLMIVEVGAPVLNLPTSRRL